MKLGRVASTVGGTGFPHDYQGAGEGEFPFFKVSDFNLPGNEVELRTCTNWINTAKIRELGGRVVPPGSILFPKVGAAMLGNARRITTRPSVFDNNVMALVPQASETRFLYYLMSSLNLGELGNPGPVPSIGEWTVKDIRVPLPARGLQRAIADFLDRETARMDSLIGKKREASQKVNERFSALTEATFEGWDRVPLKRLVEFTEGPGILSPHFRESGVPLLRLASLAGREVSIEGYVFLDPREVLQRWQHFAVREGDYLISGSATMGIVSVVTSTASGAIPYTGIIRCRPRSAEVNMRFVRFFLTSRSFMQQIEVLRTGTAIQHFGPSHLSAMWIPNPSPADQYAIGRRLDREFEVLTKLEQGISSQVALLRERRRALITAAVTGQLDVPEAA